MAVGICRRDKYKPPGDKYIDTRLYFSAIVKVSPYGRWSSSVPLADLRSLYGQFSMYRLAFIWADSCFIWRIHNLRHLYDMRGAYKINDMLRKILMSTSHICLHSSQHLRRK